MYEKPVLIYPRGSVIMFFTGEYSDYGPAGCIVTIKKCNLPELVKKYRAQKDEDGHCSLYDFPSWLVAHGYAMPAEVQNVHLGSYGEFNSEFLED